MPRLGRFANLFKISDRDSAPCGLPSPMPESRSGQLVRCECGRLSWDLEHDRCLFAHRATTWHAKATRKGEQDWQDSWIEWLKAVG